MRSKLVAYGVVMTWILGCGVPFQGNKYRDPSPVLSLGQSGSGALSPEKGLELLYSAILWRSPDDSGRNTYTSYLQNNIVEGMLFVSGDMVQSIEFNRQVKAQYNSEEILNQFYRGLFGRDVDSSGHATYLPMIQGGLYAEVLGYLITSQEFAGLDFSSHSETPQAAGQPRMDEITWLHTNVSGWAVTSTIKSVDIGRLLCIDHTKAGEWPVRDDVEGNPWVIAQVNGRWYAATYEWLRPGQICKGINADNIGAHTKRSPLDTWHPQSGELVGFLVSALARAGSTTVKERSNIVFVRWP